MSNRIALDCKERERTNTAKRWYTSPRLEKYGRLFDLTRGEGGRLPDGYGGTQETFFFKPKE